MESIIIRTTYDAKCLYSPKVREQLGATTGAGLVYPPAPRQGGVSGTIVDQAAIVLGMGGLERAEGGQGAAPGKTEPEDALSMKP